MQSNVNVSNTAKFLMKILHFIIQILCMNLNEKWDKKSLLTHAIMLDLDM